jgi:type IV pilus assembly protein PilC
VRRFAYRGRGPRGRVAGEIEAADRTAAVGELRNRAIVVTEIREKSASGGPRWRLGGRVRDRELAIFTRQLATMIGAGLPLVQCLNVLAAQSESRVLRSVTAQVVRSVETGSTLADGMSRHPRVFDDLFTHLVAAGEAGGILDVILPRLSSYIEKAAALKRTIKAAAIYPSAVLGVATVVVIFMLTFVIPTFAAMFGSLGADLPMPTRIVLRLSDSVRSHLLLLGGAAAGALCGFRQYRRTRRGQGAVDAILLSLPVVGPLIRKVAVARFTRTLGTLVASGVPILEGLRITARTAGNTTVERAVLQCRTAVTTGKTLAEPLRASGVFPPMVTQMISVGEQTGALDTMLAKIADFYEEEVDTAVAALTSVLEPIMIVILGAVIGGLVVAMYLPIFRMIAVMT